MGDHWTHDFAITVTLNRHQKRLEPQKQFEVSAHLLSSMLSSPANRRTMALRATIVTELTVNSDIHYHVIIKCQYDKSVRSYKIYLENLFRNSKIFGFVCVKPVEHYDKWVEYIKKDVQKTFDLLGICPVVKDDYEIFPKNLNFQLHENVNQDECHPARAM